MLRIMGVFRGVLAPAHGVRGGELQHFVPIRADFAPGTPIPACDFFTLGAGLPRMYEDFGDGASRFSQGLACVLPCLCR
jgi:hypothetical protein